MPPESAFTYGLINNEPQQLSTAKQFDDVGVEFDAAVFEEANEPVPMVQAVADGFGDDGLRRDARELLFEPDFESQHSPEATRGD